MRSQRALSNASKDALEPERAAKDTRCIEFELDALMGEVDSERDFEIDVFILEQDPNNEL